jgi:hypothetical protein
MSRIGLAAQRQGESDVNYISRVAHAMASQELGEFTFTDKQKREVADRARKIFKEDMGMTYTKENNKILQELAQRLEKEEIERLQKEYLQKHRDLVEKKKLEIRSRMEEQAAKKADLLGLYEKPKEAEKDLIKFSSREEELKGLFGGIKRRKTRASRKNKKRKTTRRRRV